MVLRWDHFDIHGPVVKGTCARPAASRVSSRAWGSLSGQSWCGPPGSMSQADTDSSIRPWLALTSLSLWARRGGQRGRRPGQSVQMCKSNHGPLTLQLSPPPKQVVLCHHTSVDVRQKASAEVNLHEVSLGTLKNTDRLLIIDVHVVTCLAT